ncbi:CHAD domain-containing protein [candidate division KSB1 bacterium]|nr:CHAD domain-containing protein [candidate division KSB1 bacterium]
MGKQSLYIIERQESEEKIFEKLSQTLLIRNESGTQRQGKYYDTFDWRLYQAGFYLQKEEKTLSLINRQTNKPLASIEWRSNRDPRFSDDLPASLLKKQLLPIMDVRALLPLFKCHINTQRKSILNIDEKIVCRISENTLTVNKSKKQITYFALEAIRGYRQNFIEAQKILDSLNLAKTSGDVPTLAMTLLDITPEDYSSKLHIALSPQLSSHEAFRKIALFLINVMRCNEQGIIKDIDTEFLHDFRVALRRTRSAMTQIKNVFSASIIDKYKKEFSLLAKKSNHLRDLDVYLLNKDEFFQRLPKTLRPGLDYFYNTLEIERKKEFEKFVLELKSASYHTLVKQWISFLNQSFAENERGKHYNLPVQELAKRRILKNYRKVVKQGIKMNSTTPDENYHAFRISCKKLRYLVEFFSSLFPPEALSPFLKSIKNLQTILGNYNDYSVEQEHLIDFVNSKQNCPNITAAAIGALVQDLHQRQQQIGENFSTAVDQFIKTSKAFEYYLI